MRHVHVPRHHCPGCASYESLSCVTHTLALSSALCAISTDSSLNLRVNVRDQTRVVCDLYPGLYEGYKTLNLNGEELDFLGRASGVQHAVVGASSVPPVCRRWVCCAAMSGSGCAVPPCQDHALLYEPCIASARLSARNAERCGSQGHHQPRRRRHRPLLHQPALSQTARFRVRTNSLSYIIAAPLVSFDLFSGIC